jgi:hypothetical protein
MHRFPSPADIGRTFSEMKNYAKRPEDVTKTLRVLRHKGIHVGLPMQKANGNMVFAAEDFTIAVAQLLELLDRDELDRDGVRRLIGTKP